VAHVWTQFDVLRLHCDQFNYTPYKAGDDVSELVGDYTGWKATTGTPGRNAEPVTTRSAPKSVNAGEVLQRIQNEGARTGRSPSENFKLYTAELDTLRSQGVTIVEA
jgi:hypothetical protein